MDPQNPTQPVSHAHTPHLAPGVYCTPDGTDTTNNPLKPCVYKDDNTHVSYHVYSGYKAPGEFLACAVVFAVAFVLVAAMRRWEATPARMEERAKYRQLAKKYKGDLRRRKRYYYHEYQDTKRPPKSHDNSSTKTTK